MTLRPLSTNTVCISPPRGKTPYCLIEPHNWSQILPFSCFPSSFQPYAAKAMSDIDPPMSRTSINGSISCCRDSLFHIRTAVSYTSISASYCLAMVSLVDMPLPALLVPFSWWRPELYIMALRVLILFLLISIFSYSQTHQDFQS
jgi:hypothetical protein